MRSPLLAHGLAVLALAACQAPAPPPEAPPPAVEEAPADLRAAAAADLAPPADPAARGPFPIVLCHGFSGFRNIGAIDYFYGVAAALRKDGHVVYVPEVAPFQSSDVRGAQLAAYIKSVVLPQTGAAKVTLVAHSQGGIDARFAARALPGKVAAVVTIATPHRGTEVADIAVGERRGPVELALAALLDLLGASRGQQDAWASMHNLTTTAMARWNAERPDADGVAFFSIAGRSARSQGEGLCNPPTQAAFVARWDRYLDPLSLALGLSGRIIEQNVVPLRPHDGLVSVESARWGTFLGCVPVDHFGEVCQLLGAPRGSGNAFDCVTFYRDLAGWLRERGY